jgi:hypothetical protein
MCFLIQFTLKITQKQIKIVSKQSRFEHFSLFRQWLSIRVYFAHIVVFDDTKSKVQKNIVYAFIHFAWVNYA